jgi:hypothetical protein
MMDRERQEKDLQEVFETTQEAYRAAIDNTFALQEQALEFARSLLEESRRQREAMENLVGESAKVYESLLQTPFSHHQHHPEFEEAKEAPEVSPEVS